MKAIYPGSFDPVTYGHLDLIKRASKLFDGVIVAVADNSKKDTLFSAEERKEMLKKATQGIEGVEIDGFNSLTVDYAKKKDCKVLLRGIRMVSDFEYEFQMALTNRKVAPEIETVFMMPSEKFSYLSSKLIKEVAALGKEVTCFVPEFVSNRLKEALKKE